MKQVKIKIYGRVQGVFFRYFTKTKADELSIRGFVRNMPDGGVEIIAQGNENNLEKLVEWVKEGPDSAKVEKIDVSHETLQNKFNSFDIK